MPSRKGRCIYNQVVTIYSIAGTVYDCITLYFLFLYYVAVEIRLANQIWVKIKLH